MNEKVISWTTFREFCKHRLDRSRRPEYRGIWCMYHGDGQTKLDIPCRRSDCPVWRKLYSVKKRAPIRRVIVHTDDCGKPTRKISDLDAHILVPPQNDGA